MSAWASSYYDSGYPALEFCCDCHAICFGGDRFCSLVSLDVNSAESRINTEDVGHPERSQFSHTTHSTWGGLGFVAPFLISVVYLFFSGLIDDSLTYSLVIGGGLVAAIGWLDDHRPVRHR